MSVKMSQSLFASSKGMQFSPILSLKCFYIVSSMLSLYVGIEVAFIS